MMTDLTLTKTGAIAELSSQDFFSLSKEDYTKTSLYKFGVDTMNDSYALPLIMYGAEIGTDGAGAYDAVALYDAWAQHSGPSAVSKGSPKDYVKLRATKEYIDLLNDTVPRQHVLMVGKRLFFSRMLLLDYAMYLSRRTHLVLTQLLDMIMVREKEQAKIQLAQMNEHIENLSIANDAITEYPVSAFFHPAVVLRLKNSMRFTPEGLWKAQTVEKYQRNDRGVAMTCGTVISSGYLADYFEGVPAALLKRPWISMQCRDRDDDIAWSTNGLPQDPDDHPEVREWIEAEFGSLRAYWEQLRALPQGLRYTNQ
jgi:hypothetical protein